MTPTPTSGAADLPEALRRSTAADGKTELFNLPGYPLMVRAVDFNRLHTESEMRRAALLDEMQKDALAAGQATAAQQGVAYADAHGAIIAMAREANPEHDLTSMLPFLRRFAALVAARERSAILRAIDEIEEPSYTGYENPNTFDDGCLAVADAIRARGKP